MSSHYLNEAQQRQIEAWLQEPMARSEWPTWVLIVVIHGAWLALLLFSPVLGIAWSAPLLALLGAWHLSLQHELIHGHPTRWTRVNHLLGMVPLSLWYPVGVYRTSHLLHHRDELLTLPGVDPESNYVSPSEWGRLGPAMRFLWVARKTAVGRFLFGPGQAIVQSWRDALLHVARRQGHALRDWLPHWLLVAALLWFVDRYSAFSAWQYALLVGYPALSLAMVRSHYEHRAALEPEHRIVINEAGLFMRLLFLNNNYHLVHHDLPKLPWYLIPRVYRAHRDAYLARNQGFVQHGYTKQARQYAFSPTDPAVHPSEAALLARLERQP
jgi:fatty acid desaturase